MKKMICFSFCLTLLTILTACGSNPEPVDSAELLRHLRFYGTEFSFPCLYGEISGQFGIANEDEIAYETFRYLYYDLTYQEKTVASVGFIGEKADQYTNEEIKMLVIEDEHLNALELGGTVGNADYKALTKALGKPDAQTEMGTSKVITYNWDGVDLSVIFHDDQPHQYTFVKR